MTANKSLRKLPSVDKIVGLASCKRLIGSYGRTRVVGATRKLLDNIRNEILSAGNGEDYALKSDDDLMDALSSQLEESSKPLLKKVINCSGVVIHTNLGRSMLAEAAGKAAMDSAVSCMNLEYSLKEGERGERDDILEGLITGLTGAEAATVVNNNAAAVLLVLNTLSDGKETIVSRGELIEIGGSFRLPEIMAKSGSVLKEVGTTNRTHLSDYETAINQNTALILRVHTSNYRIIGFTSKPELAELKSLAKSKSLPLMVDLGAGAVIDLERLGLKGEPTITQTLDDGADVVTISGDKLLGGPQAGIIAGDSGIIDKIRKNPLKRALRLDKMTISALEATLRIYQDPDKAISAIPTLRHLGKPVETIRAVAGEAVEILKEEFGGDAEVFAVDDICRAGSGSLPEVDIPSVSVVIKHRKMSPDTIKQWFRALDPPIIGRVEGGMFRLDMRCVDDAGQVRPRKGS
ncbi:L-seryl-tRNA(Sec) selenium transferase [hydrothermal vent metagenome]|uniref:L-seryl-tRNA(Sec) selenium transferase n=1 Tax=hydrothermal vent metagenome TaxID=652676 RepID=A0A3B1BNQ6_9ZZZZ